MNPDNINELTRTEIPGWSTVGVGDNGIDMLQCNIKVANTLIEAAEMAMRIAVIVPPTRKEDEDAVYYTQISLRSWRVEIVLAMPKGLWGSLAQKKFAYLVSEGSY